MYRVEHNLSNALGEMHKYRDGRRGLGSVIDKIDLVELHSHRNYKPIGDKTKER